MSSGVELKIDYLSGNCPVQAEGTVNGVPFYFRARGQRWAMCVGENPVGVCCGDVEGWLKTEPWGAEMFDAGWMTEEEARSIIGRCAMQYAEDAARKVMS